MERSHINEISFNYLSKISFEKEQVSLVKNLIDLGIKEKLYTKNHVPYHNIGHIERVICYCIWILNKKRDNGEVLGNTEVLLYAALFHDSGRNFKTSNKLHGIAGAKIAKEKLKDKFDLKNLNAIELLIETHAKVENIVDFKDYNFNEEEKKNLQILSNILKDADALDRNRIKLFKFAQCKSEFLRTNEAKEIYYNSDLFLKMYENS